MLQTTSQVIRTCFHVLHTTQKTSACYRGLFVSCASTDPSVSDFLLTHPVFMPCSQLCAALQQQYPSKASYHQLEYILVSVFVFSVCLCTVALFGVRYYSLTCVCTYQAEPSEGTDLEKSAYALNTKQKIVKLVCQWVALYGLLLRDDPVASEFLEVRKKSKF